MREITLDSINSSSSRSPGHTTTVQLLYVFKNKEVFYHQELLRDTQYGTFIDLSAWETDLSACSLQNGCCVTMEQAVRTVAVSTHMIKKSCLVILAKGVFITTSGYSLKDPPVYLPYLIIN